MNLSAKRLIPLCLTATLPLAAQEKPATPEKPVVRTVKPSSAAANSTYDIPGRTEPVESATIFTRATGIVSERKYDIGDRVKAGDVLAVIATPDLDQEVIAAKATLEQAEARAKTARSFSNRSANLYATRAVSQEESEQRTSSAEEAEAEMREAKANLSRLEEEQKFGMVTAPFDGTISARNFDRGDRMRGDSATSEGWLYRLVRLNDLRFVVNATPDLGFRLSQESEAKVRFNELPGKVFTAKVSRSSRVYDTATGTMRAELLIDNKELVLPAGLTGTASFSLAPAAGTFMLPTNTLVMRQGRSLVGVVQDGKAHFVDALPGRNTGTSLEMTSAALTPDSQVIVNPNAMLKEGDAVEVGAPEAPKGK